MEKDNRSNLMAEKLDEKELVSFKEFGNALIWKK
jgi:hypothetical protein